MSSLLALYVPGKLAIERHGDDIADSVLRLYAEKYHPVLVGYARRADRVVVHYDGRARAAYRLAMAFSVPGTSWVAGGRTRERTGLVLGESLDLSPLYDAIIDKHGRLITDLQRPILVDLHARGMVALPDVEGRDPWIRPPAED